MNLVLNEMEKTHSKMCDAFGLEKDKKIKLEKHSQFGYCFRVIGRPEATKVRNKSEYYELATVKSGTFFTSRSLKDLSVRYTELSSSYNQKQKGLEKEVLDIVGKEKKNA